MDFKRANVNIALLKYWGKADQNLNLPVQTSISVSADAFYTLTNVTLDPGLTKDRVILDDIELGAVQYTRVIAHLNMLRQHFNRTEFCLVTSYNHVYIRAGFASSASAFAALTAAYVAAIGAEVSNEELSRLARLGSGSASRSIHGGFVVWHKGSDHASSFAESLNIDWPAFRMLFVVVDASIKKISSRVGMQLCAEKSPSFNKYALESNALVPPMIKALQAHDLQRMGELCEQSAEMMRNVMLEAGIEYHVPLTQKIIHDIQSLRAKHHIPVYYTFDAGPNLILFTTDEYVEVVTKHLKDTKIVVSGIGGPISDETA